MLGHQLTVQMLKKVQSHKILNLEEEKVVNNLNSNTNSELVLKDARVQARNQGPTHLTSERS